MYGCVDESITDSSVFFCLLHSSMCPVLMALLCVPPLLNNFIMRELTPLILHCCYYCGRAFNLELRDDTKTETFPLKYVLRTPEYGTLFLTVRYLKIEAISTWSLHHFPSIWYVGVSGEGPGPYSVVPDVENVIKMVCAQ